MSAQAFAISLSPFLAHRNHLHPALHRVQDAISQAPAEDWNLTHIAAIAHTDSTIGDVFNVGGTGEVTIKQLAEQVLNLTKSKSEITYTPYSDAYPAGFEDMQRRVPDISKVKNAIGWAPTKGLTQIISDIAEL